MRPRLLLLLPFAYVAPALVQWLLDWPLIVALWTYLLQSFLVAGFIVARAWRATDASIPGGMHLPLSRHPRGYRPTIGQQWRVAIAIGVFCTYVALLLFWAWIQWNVGTRPTGVDCAGIGLSLVAYAIVGFATFRRQRDSDRSAHWRLFAVALPAWLRLAPAWMMMLMLNLPDQYPGTPRLLAAIAVIKIIADLLADAADRWLSTRVRSRVASLAQP